MMKTKLVALGLGAGAVVLAMASLQASWGQRAGPGSDDPFASGPASGDSRLSAPESLDPFGVVVESEQQATAREGQPAKAIFTRYVPSRDFQARLAAALKKLLAAETDEAKAEAKAQTQYVLDGYFEQDMKFREREIADIERRVKKLRAQLEKRRAAKDEIIELQLKLIEYEAEGLGFPGIPWLKNVPVIGEKFRGRATPPTPVSPPAPPTRAGVPAPRARVPAPR
ncbi:MAG: hypothetical protein ACYTG0_19760 [Planctomycetota bacterium]|jgi:hypothetical protein